MSESLGGAFEENVLAMLCFDATHATTVAMMVRADMFSTTYFRKAAVAAIEFVNTYNTAPGVHIYDLVEGDVHKSKDGDLLITALKALEESTPRMNADYVVGQLEKFVRVRSRINAYRSAIEALEEYDEERADTYSIDANPATTTSQGVWLHNDDLSFLERREDDFFSSGVDALDRKRVCPARGTMTLFIAPPKRGKSWWCVNIGKAAIMNRHTALHVTLENSEEITKRRYIQALFGMTSRELRQAPNIPIFDRDENGRGSLINFDAAYNSSGALPMALTIDNRAEIITKLRSLRNKPRLLIKEFPTGTLTIPKLHAYMDMLGRTANFVPDVLIVDYPDLMSISGTEIRVDTGRTFRNLRGLAVARGCALCVPTQGNRESEDAGTVRKGMVAEDWSKIGTADTVLTYSRTPAERKCGLARLTVDAARDEEDQFSVLMSQSYATGQFCLDSTLMSAQMQEEINRVTGDRK